MGTLWEGNGLGVGDGETTKWHEWGKKTSIKKRGRKILGQIMA